MLRGATIVEHQTPPCLLMVDKDSLISGSRYAALGFEFGAVIVAAVVGGYYVDHFLGTAPFMTLLLTLGGLVGALRLLLWSLKRHSTRGQHS